MNREINALDYKSTAKPSQEHEKGRCSSSLPMKWSDGQRTGDEKAPTAALGCPNIRPGIFAPDIITKNFTFGTFVRAVPCQTVFNIKSYQYKQFTQNKTIETKFHILQNLISLFLTSFFILQNLISFILEKAQMQILIALMYLFLHSWNSRR